MKLTLLIWHCTATPAGRSVSVDDIRQWHMVERGWDRLGYSDMIALNGALINLTSFDTDDEVSNDEKTWGVAGRNSGSRHVVYVGGLNVDTRTPKQRETMEIYTRYMVLRHRNIRVAGHNQFSAKLCPQFEVPTWCRSIGIDEKNIYDVQTS